jgi:hypothetical protein
VLSTALATSASGQAQSIIRVPNNTAHLGQRAVVQAALASPATPPLGADLTNGLVLTLVAGAALAGCDLDDGAVDAGLQMVLHLHRRDRGDRVLSGTSIAQDHQELRPCVAPARWSPAPDFFPLGLLLATFAVWVDDEAKALHDPSDRYRCT